MSRPLSRMALGVVAALTLGGLVWAQDSAPVSRPGPVTAAEAALDRAEQTALPKDQVAAARRYANACVRAWGAEAIQTTRCRLRLGEALASNEDSTEARAVLGDVIARLSAAGPAEAGRLARARSSLGYALIHATLYADAEAPLTAALTVQESLFGDAHIDTFRTLRRLASVRVFQVRLADAEALLARADAAAARTDIPAGDRAILLVMRGRLADRSGKSDEAERLLRQALTVMDEAFQQYDPRRGLALSTLSNVLNNALTRRDEAEAVARLDLEIREHAYEALDPRIGTALNNLANVMIGMGRPEEAEPLLRRAVALAEAADGPQSMALAIRLHNHASVLDILGRTEEAEALLRRGIAIHQQTAPDNPNISRQQLKLAGLRRDAGDLAAAESLVRQALAIRRGALGEAHALTIESLRILGEIQLESGQAQHAETTLREAFTLAARLGGEDGYEAFLAQSWLGGALLAQGRTEEAWNQGLAAMHGLRRAERPDARRPKGAVYIALAQLLNIAAKRPPRQDDEREAIFNAMQLASRSSAGVATARTAARLAEADPALATLDGRIRALRVRVSNLERQRAQAYGRSEAAAIREAGAALTAERVTLSAAERELSDRHPLFADFAGRLSVRIADINGADGVLRNGEGLLLATQSPTGLHLMLATADRVRFESAALRQDDMAAMVARVRKGVRLEGAVSPSDLPEFDLAAAHDLYRRIIAPFRNDLRGVETLYVVPDGPLASIPLSLLVVAPAATQTDPFERYRRTRFLGDELALATLPSPAALVAARRHTRPSRAREALIAFADPALSGTEKVRTLAEWASLRNATSAGAVSTRNAATVCRLRPLPAARREALALSERLGSRTSDVFLGRAASERTVFELNASGALAQGRIILFATHGLVSGEESVAVEPALVLTPAQGCAANVEAEDGVLTASEIATLTFDADWVILSGCNTAAPDGRAGATPLSGLARAFLYAGARRLLVSHWSVDSEAAADLTSTLFDPRNRALTPAAALQQAMRAMRESRGAQAYRAHPAFWAPFVLVGDGR